MDRITETPNVKQHLEAALATLNRFEFIRCGMAHERIRRDSGGQKPLPDPTTDHGLLRAKYCDSKTRSTRLACAHTGARNEFTALLDSLPAGAIDVDRIASWKQKLTELDLAIIDVDWRKSDTELAHARQSAILCSDGGDTAGNVAKLKSIDEEIANLMREHERYVGRLTQLRDDVLGEIRAAIEAGF